MCTHKINNKQANKHSFVGIKYPRILSRYWNLRLLTWNALFYGPTWQWIVSSCNCLKRLTVNKLIRRKNNFNLLEVHHRKWICLSTHVGFNSIDTWRAISKSVAPISVDELFCCCVPMYIYIYIIKSMYNNTTFIHIKMYSWCIYITTHIT